jgi:hypothetical protein
MPKRKAKATAGSIPKQKGIMIASPTFPPTPGRIPKIRPMGITSIRIPNTFQVSISNNP